MNKKEGPVHHEPGPFLGLILKIEASNTPAIGTFLGFSKRFLAGAARGAGGLPEKRGFGVSYTHEQTLFENHSKPGRHFVHRT
jgi:hypothetical protein